MTRGLIALTTVLVAFMAAGPASAATITVNCAHANLQTKIDNAAPGSTLKIKNTCVGQFSVAKDLKLVGDPSATLDGDQQPHTLQVTAGKVLLSHLIVTGGFSTALGDGTGISHLGGDLTLRHVTVRGNRINTPGNGPGALCSGAGMFSSGGTLKIFDSLFAKNVAKARASNAADVFGGALFRSGNLRIEDSTFGNNQAVSRPNGTNAGSAQGGAIVLNNGELVIRRSTFEGNLAKVDAPGGGVTALGGAIYVDGSSTLGFHGSKFIANRAAAITDGSQADAHGGGIYAEVTSGGFIGTRFAGNTTHTDSGGDASATGGGGFVDSGLEFELDHVRVSSNSADSHAASGNADAQGGGFQFAALVNLKASTFDANTADAPEGGIRTATGGALDVSDGGVRMVTSTVSRNEASAPNGQALGGGILLDAATASSFIKNSTVSANRATGNTSRGGGIDSFANTLDLVNATIARNSAKLGGGLYKETGFVTLKATILSANTATTGPNCGGSIDTAGHNLISAKRDCTITPLPSDIVGKGAKLGPLGNHGGPTETISLLAGSPAINAIPSAQCAVDRDQRGVKRPQGNRCDIGAFEVRR